MNLEAIHSGLKQPNICLMHDDITTVKKIINFIKILTHEKLPYFDSASINKFH